MSETPKLLMEKDGPIGWIIFNQPEKRNAVSQEMWQAMPKYVHELVTDDAIRVVVLRGAGEQAFVAGRRHLAVQGPAPQHGRRGGVPPHLGARARRARHALEAAPRHDPRLLRGRRGQHRHHR